MSRKMSDPGVHEFNSRIIISEKWRIPSSGQHFYRYGFSQYRNGCIDRSKLYHPLFVFILPIVFNLKQLCSAFTPHNKPGFQILMGNFGYFLALNLHMNLLLSLVFTMATVSHLIHYYHYHYDRGQPYMNVFNMMSGQLTYLSIGMSDETIIKRLLKVSKINFKLIILSQRSILIASFVSVFSSLIVRDQSFKTVIIALLNSIFMTLTVSVVLNIIMTQMFYLFIICYYLKLKQREEIGRASCRERV